MLHIKDYRCDYEVTPNSVSLTGVVDELQFWYQEVVVVVFESWHSFPAQY